MLPTAGPGSVCQLRGAAIWNEPICLIFGEQQQNTRIQLVRDFGPFEGWIEDGDNLTTMLICRLLLLSEHKSPTLKRFSRCDALSQQEDETDIETMTLFMLDYKDVQGGSRFLELADPFQDKPN